MYVKILKYLLRYNMYKSRMHHEYTLVFKCANLDDNIFIDMHVYFLIFDMVLGNK